MDIDRIWTLSNRTLVLLVIVAGAMVIYGVI